MAKIYIDDVRKAAIEHDWELVSDEYKNLDSTLEFICSEGHHVFLPYKKVRDKFECPICIQNQYTYFDDKVISKKKNIQRSIGLDQATHTTGYSIFDEGENGYLYAASSSNNYLKEKATLDNEGKWKITFDDNKATITAQGTNTHNTIKYNGSSNSNLFSCYENGQKDIAIYAKLAKWGGAGALVPITGFANSVASCAIEFGVEGQVFGIGCKIFTIAGPVILYGVFATWLLGLGYWLMQIWG